MNPVTPLHKTATEASNATDVLILVEDPGAANYVVDLPAILAQSSLKTRLVAAGPAVAQLGLTDTLFETAETGSSADMLFDVMQPRILVTGTSEDPDALGLGLIDTARRRGITSVGVVDGAPNPELRFRGRGENALAHAPDYLLVPDQATRSAYINCGFSADQVHTCGHPLFDRVRETRRTLDTEDRTRQRHQLFGDVGERPVIIFLAEVSDGLDPAQFRRQPDYTLTGSGQSNRRTDIVLEEFVTACKATIPDAFTVLRLHPKNNRDEFAAYANAVDQISTEGAVAPILHAADLVVGMTTVALVEATLLGRPTLSILPRPQESDWLPTIASGITPMVCGRADIAPALRATLGAPVDDEWIETLIPSGAAARVGAVIQSIYSGTAPQ